MSNGSIIFLFKNAIYQVINNIYLFIHIMSPIDFRREMITLYTLYETNENVLLILRYIGLVTPLLKLNSKESLH